MNATQLRTRSWDRCARRTGDPPLRRRHPHPNPARRRARPIQPPPPLLAAGGSCVALKCSSQRGAVHLRRPAWRFADRQRGPSRGARAQRRLSSVTAPTAATRDRGRSSSSSSSSTSSCRIPTRHQARGSALRTGSTGSAAARWACFSSPTQPHWALRSRPARTCLSSSPRSRSLCSSRPRSSGWCGKAGTPAASSGWRRRVALGSQQVCAPQESCAVCVAC
jgi:hypothetical protein